MTPPPLPHTHNSDFKETRKTILIISLWNIFFFLNQHRIIVRPNHNAGWNDCFTLSLFTPVSYVPIDLYNSAFRVNHLNSLPISPAEKSSRYSHSPKLSLPFKNIHKQNWKNLYFWYIQCHPFQFIMEFLFLMEFLPKPEPEDSPSIEVELAMKVGSRISRGRMIRAASISPLLVSKPPPGLSVTEAESRSGTNTLTLIRDLNRYFRMSVFTRDLKKYLHNNSIFTYARLTTITVIFSRDLKYNLTLIYHF